MPGDKRGEDRMNIVVCDDDEMIRKQVIRMCLKFQDETQITGEIVEMSSGEEVLSYKEPIDVLILDIELPGKNGIQVMREIELEQNYDFIIFVSSHQEAVWNSFSCKTVGFIPKPIEYDQLKRILKKVAELKNEEFLIEIDTDQGVCVVKSNDLIYIKGEGSYTRIVTQKESLIVRKTLSQWEKQLNSMNMLRAHKSYFINMEYIKNIKQSVILDTGEEIKISRLRKSELLEKYHNFLKKKAFFI